MFKNVTKEQLKVPAQIDYLADLRDFVTRIGKKHGFSDKVINAFKLAIDEAGTNIMRHAYRETGGEGFITIRAIAKQNSLTICLIDQGKYFDPQHVKDPDLRRYVDIGKKGGLGIFIMRRLMDEIEYRKTEEGNELRLTKYRDATLGKMARLSIHQAVSGAVKAIPFSLKAKYWVRTSSVLLALAIVTYLYYFLEAKRQESAAFFGEFNYASNLVASSFQANPGILDDASGMLAREAIAKTYAIDEVRKIIHEVVLVDPIGTIVGHIDSSKLYQKFDSPQERSEVRPGIFAYMLPTALANGQLSSKEVYDHVVSISDATLHIRALKESLDKQIAARRWAYARNVLLMFVPSSAGAFLLIYILMNPFRKLADWVRRADHGDIEDEMDIDASTEIGEIAQAFSEITNRFRESQKNLADQERLQKEMQVAQEIQQTLLPSEFPDLEGYELASHYEAAREVGGDYYDFVEVDKDTLGIAVADVSGKGVPGSLVMTMIRTALRTEARGLKDAAEVLARVNDFVIGDMKKGMFVTVFYVIIDSKRRRLNYASAGHNPMILYRASTKKTYYLNPRGFPIGIQLHEKDLFKKSIESDTIQMAEDDILLIYTDGITEAMNAKRELFGEERLLKIFREHGHLRVKPFVEQIREEILSFTEGVPQSDDITLVAAREKTSPEKEELRRAKQAHKLIETGTSIREACESVGITTYAYYNKYKKEFEEKGLENYEIDIEVSVEAKHVAIEDKVKIFDIIKNHPDYGAKRISEELNTEVYGFTQIGESKIYDELVRSRLNTRQLREAFVARGGRTRRPIKQPGTPMLTLDGKIILDRSGDIAPVSKEALPQPKAPRHIEKLPPRVPPQSEEPPVEIVPRALPVPLRNEPLPIFARSTSDSEREHDADFNENEIDGSILQAPIEELLDKGRFQSDVSIFPPGGAVILPDEPAPLQIFLDAGEQAARAEKDRREVDLGAPSQQDLPSEISAQPSQKDVRFPSGESNARPASGMLEITFEDLFAGGSILDEHQTASEVVHEQPEPNASTPAATPPASSTVSSRPEEEVGFFAVEDVLRQGDDGAYTDSTTQLLPVDEDEEVSQPSANVPSFANGASVTEQTPPAMELDLPYVDIHEILGQGAFEGSSYLVEEGSAVETEAVMIQSEADSQPRQAAGHYARSGSPGNGVRGGFSGQRAAAREDDRERLLIAGLRHYKNQRFNEAIAEFEKAIQVYPNFKEAYSILGNAYFRNRMFDKAANAYTRVKEMDPNDTTAFENMGVIFANRGEYMLAMKEWQRVLEIDPGRDDIREKIERASRMLTRKTTV